MGLRFTRIGDLVPTYEKTEKGVKGENICDERKHRFFEIKLTK